MRAKLLTIVTCALLMAVTAQAEATHLQVIPLAGAERTEAINQIGHIRYTQDSLLIYSRSNELLYQAAFADTHKMVFGEVHDTPTGSNEAVAGTLRVYPNPAQDALLLDNTQAATVTILTMQGQVVTTMPAQAGTTVIPVSSLQTGTYFLLIDSEIVKFIKK